MPRLLERLTGVNLSALRPAAGPHRLPGGVAWQPTDGKSFPGGWQSVTLAGDGANVPMTAYLRTMNGTRVVVAADRGEWRLDYANHLSGFPRSVRIRSAEGGTIDLSAVVDELEINTGIDDKAFEVTVPPKPPR